MKAVNRCEALLFYPRPILIRSSAVSNSAFLNLTARPILKYGISPAMRQQ
jgi:hypothetical protein